MGSDDRDIPVVEAPTTVVSPTETETEQERGTRKGLEHEERSIISRGQRKINLIWELTQALIALSSVGAGVFIFVHQAITGEESADLPTTLSSMIFLVLGFYFARTNHQTIGGVGQKPSDPPYQGR